MNQQELGRLSVAIKAAYPEFKGMDEPEQKAMWRWALKDKRIEVAMETLQDYILESPFPPKISDIVNGQKDGRMEYTRAEMKERQAMIRKKQIELYKAIDDKHRLQLAAENPEAPDATTHDLIEWAKGVAERGGLNGTEVN